MPSLRVLVLGVLLLPLGCGTAGQRQALNAPAISASPALPAEVYAADCASCHGKSGKGDGPAAATLKTRPPDLTTLKQRHREFPGGHVYQVIKWGGGAPGKEMPVWSAAMSKAGIHDEAEISARVMALTNYVESLQKP